MSEYEEVEHPDEMPKERRSPELDPSGLPSLPEDVDLPLDEPVPEESRGGVQPNKTATPKPNKTADVRERDE